MTDAQLAKHFADLQHSIKSTQAMIPVIAAAVGAGVALFGQAGTFVWERVSSRIGARRRWEDYAFRTCLTLMDNFTRYVLLTPGVDSLCKHVKQGETVGGRYRYAGLKTLISELKAELCRLPREPIPH